MARFLPEGEITLSSPPGLADDLDNEVVVIGSRNLSRSQASGWEPVDKPRDDSGGELSEESMRNMHLLDDKYDINHEARPTIWLPARGPKAKLQNRFIIKFIYCSTLAVPSDQRRLHIPHRSTMREPASSFVGCYSCEASNKGIMLAKLKLSLVTGFH